MLIPHINTTYGISAFGAYFFAQSLLQPFALLSDFGFNVIGIKAIANTQFSISDRNEIVSFIFLFKIIVSISCLLFFFFLCFLKAKYFDYELLTFFVLISSLLQLNQPIWFFQGVEKNHIYTIINLISKVFFGIGIWLFSYKGQKILIIPAIEAVSYGIAMLLSVISMVYIEKYRFVYSNFKKHFFLTKESFNVMVISLLNWATVSGTAIILRGSVSEIEYGIFSSFSRLIYYVFAIFQPINQSLQPVFSKKFFEQYSKALGLFKKSLLLLTLLLVIFTIVFVSFIPLISKFLFGSKYLLIITNVEYCIYIYTMLVWVVLIILNNFSSIQYFVSNNLTKTYRNLYSIDAFLSISLAYFFISIGKGLIGFSSAMVISEFIFTNMLLYRIFFVKRSINII